MKIIFCNEELSAMRNLGSSIQDINKSFFVKYRNLKKRSNAEDESPESKPTHIPTAPN